MSELPEGWASASIAEVTQDIPNVNPETHPDQEFGYVDISSINNSNYSITDVKNIKGANAPSRAKRPLQAGDVLFSNVRTYLRNIAIVPDNSHAQICSTGFTVLRSNRAVASRYLFRWLLTDDFIKRVTPKQTGTHYPAISDRIVKSEAIPLPPLNEQRRIVAKLEKLLSRVDAAHARLATIPRILKRFRQSVLAAACSGRLTADWRGSNADVGTAADLIRKLNIDRKREYEVACETAKRTGGKKPKCLHHMSFIPVIEDGLNDLPDNWCMTRIGDVSECLDYRRIPINKAERLKRQGSIPYYGANGQTGWIDDYIFDEELILLVEDETFVGREKPFSYVIRGKSWVNNHAHVLKPCGEISADYLNICWSYYDFTPLTSGTTGRRKLTQEALLEAMFPFAPLAEQHEIVRRVEALFKTADALEARYRIARTHVDKLTQSILARAFRGELVITEAELARQEGRDYEPASVLLERIRQERRQQPEPAKSRSKRAPRSKKDAPTKKMFA